MEWIYALLAIPPLIALYFLAKKAQEVLSIKKVYVVDIGTGGVIDIGLKARGDDIIREGEVIGKLSNYVYTKIGGNYYIFTAVINQKPFPIKFVAVDADYVYAALDKQATDRAILNYLDDQLRAIEELRRRSPIEKILDNGELVVFALLVFLSSVMIVGPGIYLTALHLDALSTSLEKVVEYIYSKNDTITGVEIYG
ncbi:MAG: hypothetical protein QXD29_06200 [Thermoplasmata archaeon]